MIENRTGLFGNYYGSPYTSSAPLTEEQMKVNARYIYNALTNDGWTINSICGMLGNMETESSINPGRWQNDRVGGDPTGHGYSLVQWTPYTNYTDWATASGYTDPSEMDTALDRIKYELANNLQWIPTITYPMTFQAFKVSTINPYDLAMIFLANYERPAEPYQPLRGEQAVKWYNYLQGEFGTDEKKKFPWFLYSRKLRDKYLTKFK
ncbi:MAG: hypothetical protein IIT81_01790 [Mycoplasmataceae bacterium]|nr:hypothetical protein [Bacilli bacterium]MBQ5500926.1 hypothetical protein [Mycoplasmataceae bacterium]